MDHVEELLTSAAKAAGVEGKVRHFQLPYRPEFHIGVGKNRWNPLESDGDEACLEAKLCLNVTWYEIFVSVGRHGNSVREYYADHKGDRQAARRYAGTRYAANIGRDTV